jgi:hypothetical protein
MDSLFIIFYVFFLIVCWFLSTSTIVNGEHNSTAFKIKTLFYWLGVVISFLVGHYLFI